MSAEQPDTGRRSLRGVLLRLGGAVLILALIAAVVVPLMMTSGPYYFSRYHLLNRRFVNLENSAHEGIGCRDCHETNALVNGAQLVADFYLETFKAQQTTRYFKFGSPRSANCKKCHDENWSWQAKRTDRIPHPAHVRVTDEKRACTQCHKWTAHLETYMSKHQKMPFSGVCVTYGCHVGTKKSDQCFNCHHILHNDAEQWDTKHPSVVKETGQNACLESCHKVNQCQQCHTTGEKPQFTGMTIQVGMESIERLHVRKDWIPRYHGTEALKDQGKCLLCHQSQGECQECHRNRPAFHGQVTTWVGRHNKVAKTITDPRCLICHKKPWCEDCHKQFKEME